MGRYAFWNHLEQLDSPSGETLYGVPCEQHPGPKAHYVYLLDLDEETVAQIRALPMDRKYRAQKHFGNFRLSRNPCSAVIDGVSVRPKLDANDGPTQVLLNMTRWLPVHRCDDHRTFIAELILDTATRAQSKLALRSAARRVMDTLLWVWTADGVPEGTTEVDWRGKDKLKRDFQYLPHTFEAHERWHKYGRGGLVHEHIVPRSVIVQRLLDVPPNDVAGMLEFLGRYCLGAIITEEQHGLLARDSMPADKDAAEVPWSFDGPHNDPYARYDGAPFVLHRRPEERGSDSECTYCGYGAPNG